MVTCCNVTILYSIRFSSVRRRFLSELREAQSNQNTLVSIIEGMKFVRVKMFPVEEIEDRFAFLQVYHPTIVSRYYAMFHVGMCQVVHR